MPHSAVLSRLFKKPTRPDTWAQILEDRKDGLLPFLKEVGQRSLGNTPIWDTKGSLTVNVGENLEIGHLVSCDKSKFSLNTRGIFIFDRKTFQQFPAQGEVVRTSMKVYGLTLGGEWLLITIEGEYSWRGPMKVTGKWVRIENIGPYFWISRGVDLRNAMRGFTEIIRSHTARRRELLNEAEHLLAEMQFEDDLLGLQD